MHIKLHRVPHFDYRSVMFRRRRRAFTLSIGLLALGTGGCDGSGEGGEAGDTDGATGTEVTTGPTGGPVTDPGSSTSADPTGSAGSTTSGTEPATTNPTSDGSTSTGANASCEGISEVVAGAVACRAETSRCTLSVPPSTSCAEVCDELGQTCLRAYQESETCFAAVYEESLGCEDAPAEPSFCQCGDPAIQYPQAQVVTIGDSTMNNTGQPGELGWGNVFPPFGVVPENLHNFGRSGASSLDFEQRPQWASAQALLGPDVYLFIQFGHNDSHDNPESHTDPGEAPDYEGTYRERLLVYADAARAAGATPVILTSLGRMLFNDDGTTRASLGNYPPSARKLAEDEGMLMLDANRASRGDYERLGPEQTLEMYSFDEPTHFNPEGATRMAELTVRLACIESEALCALFLPLD